MSDVAIRVDGLGKRYRIGELQKYKALRDTLAGVLTAPVRAAGSLLAGNLFSQNGHGRDNYIWALKNVSFEIKQGEVVGVIGRNGAGKSTLLKILSRITEPTEGYAHLRGRVGSLLEVGTGFHPELTGRENVYLNGSILGMRRNEIDNKFDEIVAFAEIDRFIDTQVKLYSSGMYVRLAFSVAAHLETEILLVDEVLAVGDFEFQKKCLGKMDQAANGGRTVLFISHNMAAVQQLCTRTILIRNGQIYSDGESTTVIKDYLSIFNDNQAHVYDLDNPDRARLGGLFLTGGRVLNCQNLPTKNVIAGNPITLELDYENRINAQNVTVSLTIYNQFGIPVTNMNSPLTSATFNDLGVRGHLRCFIARTPFPPGQYRVAVALHSFSKMTDHIPNALKFDLESSTFYSSAKVPDIRYCSVMIDHNWSYEPLT